MNLRHKLSALNDIATKRVIKQFAARYDLVYFGRVDAQEDDHQLVRGMTVATSHRDNHYTVGTVDGRDIVFVQRRNTVTFPGKPSAQYKWLILQVDLPVGGLPHMFVDAHHHDATFYANMFVRYPHFQDITQHVQQGGQVLDRYCKIFAQPSDYADVTALLTKDFVSTLTQHFQQFDLEINDDIAYVYSSNSVVTLATLTEMLRAGLWLTTVLVANKNPAASGV